ncbi:MAG: MFS transporter, partial [Pseudomonadota bacterium]
YTIATLASAALLLARGGLADTVPLGRLAPMILIAYAAVALGMALNPTVWLLVPLVFGLRFCGQGMMGHMAMTAMGRWFVAQRGRAVSVAGLGYALGEMTLPALVVFGIAAIGWRESWGVVAAILALGLVPLLAMLLSRERVPQGQEGAGDVTAGLGGRHWTRGEVLRDGLFHRMLPGLLTPGFIGTVVVFHQVRLAEDKGWELIEMAPAFTGYAAAAILSALVSGPIVDRLGPARLLPVFILPMGLGTALIGLIPGVEAWYLGLLLLGTAQGMYNTLLGALLPAIWGTRHLGGVRALAMTAMVVSTAIGPGITGALIDAGLPFATQCVAMGLWCGAVALLFQRLRLRLAPA